MADLCWWLVRVRAVVTRLAAPKKQVMPGSNALETLQIRETGINQDLGTGNLGQRY